MMQEITTQISSGKKVLLRVDFDVPVEEGNILEPFRIIQQKECVEQLRTSAARVLMVAHISAVETFEAILPELKQLLGQDITFVKNVEAIPAFLSGSQKLGLLENTRTWPGEKSNDAAFAQQLATGFDIYVNNAFAVAHREHASVVAVTQYLPSYAGPLLLTETDQLTQAMNAPEGGKVVVMGGAKASTKIPVIKNFLSKAEAVLVGGVIANDVLKAKGEDVQQSVVDEDAGTLLNGVNLNDPRLVIPTDFVIDQDKFLDIGQQSIERFTNAIRAAQIAIWNGPMGMFEDKRFIEGTREVAQAVAGVPLSIVGGGDTIAAIEQLGLTGKYTFVSTGGGAMLAFLAGEQLPALKALNYYG